MHPTNNYAGTLADGTEFDSSYKRGEPTTFAHNQVRRRAAAASA
jgi:FKBP-type peptidyl-prolyl cis-trans isomerase FklB